MLLQTDEGEKHMRVVVYCMYTAAQQVPVKKEHVRLLQCTGTRGPKSV